MRVLMLQVDGPTTLALERAFNANRRSLYSVDTTREAIETARLYDFDVIAIGTGKRGDGRLALSGVRSAGIRVPIVMLTGGNGHAHRVECLDMGADDCLTVPAHTDELMATLRALSRRRHGLQASSLSVGDLLLDLAYRTISVQGVALSLTPREYRLLEALCTAKGRPRSKAQLLDHVYDAEDDAPHEQAIVVLVCRLRKHLSKVKSEVVLETLWGMGYVLRPGNKSEGTIRTHSDIYDLPLFAGCA